MNMARIALAAAGMLAACTNHEEREITPWLKVDIRRPVTGTSGVIVVGSRDDVFYLKHGRRWTRLGTGHSSSYMVLGDGQAVLADLHDQNGLQLLREGEKPQRMTGGAASVVPDGSSIDMFSCRVYAKNAGCTEAHIDRYDLNGAVARTFDIVLPKAYPECQQMGIHGYDNSGVPYVSSTCPYNSTTAKCVLQSSTSTYVVGADQPWTACNDFSGAGVSLVKPRTYVVLN